MDFQIAFDPNIQQIVDTLNKPMGVVFASPLFYGDDRIDKLYAPGAMPEKFKGKPVGDIVKAHGYTEKDVEAIALATEAVREWLNAEKAKRVAEQYSNCVHSGEPIDEKSVGLMGYDSPLFKYMDDKSGAAVFAGHELLRNNVEATNAAIVNPGAKQKLSLMGVEYAEGIQKDAIQRLKTSAELFRQAGQPAHAEKISQLADVLGKGLTSVARPSLWDMLSARLKNLDQAGMTPSEEVNRLFDTALSSLGRQQLAADQANKSRVQPKKLGM